MSVTDQLIAELHNVRRNAFERSYKEQELLQKQRDEWYKKAQLTVSIIGLVSLFSLFIAIRNNTPTLRNSVHQSTSASVITVDRMLVDKPNLYKLLYKDAPVTDMDNREEIEAAAQTILDLLDLSVTQVTEFGSEWVAPYAWDNWIIDMFDHSPVIREYYETHSQWYGPGLEERYKKGKKRAGERAKAQSTGAS